MIHPDLLLKDTYVWTDYNPKNVLFKFLRNLTFISYNLAMNCKHFYFQTNIASNYQAMNI